MTNTVTMSLEDAKKILEAFETDEWQKKLQAAITLRSILDKASPEKNVVVTTDESGRCVAVTRQDEEGRILSVIWEAACKCLLEEDPFAEVTVSHVRPGPNGLYTAEVESEERLSVGAELFLHAQNLRCKSTQKRLATLWGYEKSNTATPETSTEDQSVIDALTKVLQLEIINDGCMVIARTKIPHRFGAQVSLGGTSYTEAKQQAVLQVVEQIQRALKVCRGTL